LPNDEHTKLGAYIAEKFYDDPAGYAQAVLGFQPDLWQEQVLSSVRDHRRTAVRSGHGVGKTRLAAAAIHWFMATRSYPRIRCTANTEKQIMSVLWSELATVNRAALNKDLFEYSRTSFRLKDAPETHFAEAIAWSENNSEAFAGIHAKNVLYIFDEASAIADIIWEVSQGAMTSPGARWLCLGNPTRNTGKFHECFGKNKAELNDSDSSRWNAFTISCFDSQRTNPANSPYIGEIEREYGKDSDPYRVRVLGLPPQLEEQQFIGIELFESALYRTVRSYDHEPRILGVDVARFGDDSSALVDRRGRVMKLLKKIRGQDTMQIVGQVIHALDEAKREGEEYDYVCVDVIGIGAGVYDRLKEQGYHNVLAVNVGEKPRIEKAKNLRAELWQRYKDWLKEGHVTEEFRDDTIGPQYSFDSNGRLVIERKEDMKKRGLASPDIADAACLTFYPTNPIKASQKIRPKPKNVPTWAKRAGIR
jgi:hypothetical protein